MINQINIDTYNPSSEDKIFLDANVWLYLFCPIGNYRTEVVDTYNRFFGKMLQNKCKIYTTSMVLSEFFNTYTRIDFKIKKKENSLIYKDYKRDFRNTEYFNTLSNDICNIIKDKILKHSIRLSDSFDFIDMINILTSDKNFDYNDKYFAKLCEDNNIKILTNDKDFLNITNNIDIITA